MPFFAQTFPPPLLQLPWRLAQGEMELPIGPKLRPSFHASHRLLSREEPEPGPQCQRLVHPQEMPLGVSPSN